MIFDDKRSRCVVFFSHCLLDQNTRFPGIAVQPGAIEPLTQALLDAGVGIEQLPCPEMKYWGGVGRRWVLPPIKMSPRLIDSRFEAFFELSFRLAWKAYVGLCEWEAAKASRMIRNFAKCEYMVAGIVAMNDSPTCGLDMTMRIPEALVEAKHICVDWSHPVLGEMSRSLPQLLSQGSGPFMGALKKRIERSKVETEFFGFNPWGDVQKEVDDIVPSLLARVGK